MKLKNYLQDGAGYQARAVLMHLQSHTEDMDVEVGRWENGREQGYIVRIPSKSWVGPYLNIAFFEHRNSDDICALRWHQTDINMPNITNATFEYDGERIYSTKHDVTKGWGYCSYVEAAEWIAEELKKHSERDYSK